MAETFTYDLISFLRVLYRRRFFILKGTAVVTVLVVIASLVWPQTWRADARILVSTPKFKENLQLVPKPFDVIAYQGILNADSLKGEIITTLKWLREATQDLQSESKIQRLRSNLGAKGETLSACQLIQNTTRSILSELLVPELERENEWWKTRIVILSQLSAEELESAQKLDPYQLDDLTVFDLRKMLSSQVDKVIETNLETVYSPLIRFSGEFDTAVKAKLLTNLWLDLFLAKAERTVHDKITSEIRSKKRRAAELEIQLASAEVERTEYKNQAQLNLLRSEAASKQILLYGVEELRSVENSTEEAFDLEEESSKPWFMKEKRKQFDRLTYTVSPNYENALLPKYQRLIMEESFLKERLRSLNGQESPEVEEYHNKLKDVQAELAAAKAQIDQISGEITTTIQTIRDHEVKLAALERKIQQCQSYLSSLQPLLDEAALLESGEKESRYADVSADRAIKPDKRVFPKRSIMVLAGAALAFFFFVGLAFFADIWNEITKPEETTAAQAE